MMITAASAVAIRLPVTDQLTVRNFLMVRDTAISHKTKKFYCGPELTPRVE